MAFELVKKILVFCVQQLAQKGAKLHVFSLLAKKKSTKTSTFPFFQHRAIV
jgi:hypothetical protein